MLRFLGTLGLYFLSYSSTLNGQTLSQVYGDSLTKQAQTVYVKGTSGLTTYESSAAGSKQTHASFEQEVGGWLGESRVAGIKLVNSNARVPFELNDSMAHVSFTDVRFMGRLWFLQPSLGVTLSEINVNQAGEKTLGLLTTGINAGLGIVANLHQGLVFSAELLNSHPTRNYDKFNKGTQQGDRQDGDAYFSFDVTDRVIDFIVGYRMRAYTIITQETSFKESSQGAYLGLRMGFYF